MGKGAKLEHTSGEGGTETGEHVLDVFGTDRGGLPRQTLTLGFPPGVLPNCHVQLDIPEELKGVGFILSPGALDSCPPPGGRALGLCL